jgi:LysM repeat protein
VKNSSTLKSALVVVGGGLAVSPATALELGDVKVHSSLGQPLRASIAYALAPNEALSDTCVTLQRNMDASGLPALNSASLIVADGVIAITGSAVVREPMMTMRVSIRCPYTAQLTREYMMFIDPAGTAAAPIEAPVASQPQITTPQAAPAPVATRPRAVNPEPIGDVSRYQVQPGESLSEIVQRMDVRINGFWGTVNAVFAANPDAFLDNDPNKLKAGSWLTIPGSATEAVVATDTTDVSPVEPAATSAAYEPASDVAPLDEPVAAETVEPVADLQPGDVIIDSNNPFVAPVDSANDETVVIPDTLLEGPVTTSESPNVPVATIQRTAPSETSKTNWLLWLAGGGVAIIIGMLLFGRRFRDKFGSAPIAPVVPQRRSTDGDTQKVEAIGDVDMDIVDTANTAENLALDADLVVGTGLQEGADVDVAQDFGFAATTDLDLELPEEMSSGVDSPETDIIPPLRVDESSILESEVLPEDDYDMSVIVDATKMPHPDDVTERDLEAIQVDTDDDDDDLITGDYTVSQEVDYKILEQDYEDEMTATQALNAEIQKAAEDLAVRMDDDADDATSEMPLATVHELDVTAQMPGRTTQEIADDDDTGINPTVNLDTEGDTVEMREDNTVEMPKGGSKAG